MANLAQRLARASSNRSIPLAIATALLAISPLATRAEEFDPQQVIENITVKGGTISITEDAVFITFTRPEIEAANGGELSIKGTATADVLAVGGGGGGGRVVAVNNGAGGGGGAGGFVEVFGVSLKGNYTIEVGKGGAGEKSASKLSVATRGGNGGDTTIKQSGNQHSQISIAYGGGGGGAGGKMNSKTGAGQAGGSGGGGSATQQKSSGTAINAEKGGAGVSGQGNDGGDCNVRLTAGGGGGAGGLGVTPETVYVAATGGAGLQSEITGAWYAGGGAGGFAAAKGGPGSVPGSIGGGGSGGDGTNTDSRDANPNTGSGGGGSTHTSMSGNGADGIFIVKITGYLSGGVFPPQSKELTWTGEEQIVAGDDKSGFYTVTGNVGTNADHYLMTVTLTEKGHDIGWDEDAPGVIDEWTAQVQWEITKKQVPKPAKTQETFTYNGSVQQGYQTSDYYSLSAENTQTTAGTYRVTAKLNDEKNNMEWADLPVGAPTERNDLTWTIAKKKIPTPVKNGTYPYKFTYTGAEQQGYKDSDDYTYDAQNRQTNAGTYTPTATLKDPQNTEWEEPAKAAALSWTIDPQKVDDNKISVKNLTFTGVEQTTFTRDAAQTNQFSLVDDKGTDAHDYTMTATLNNPPDITNYTWNDGSTDPKTWGWSIMAQTVQWPPEGAETAYTYDGQQHEPIPPSDWYEIEGTSLATAAGDNYTCTATLKYNRENQVNVKWSDGTTEAKTWNWKIGKQTVALPEVHDYVYDEQPKGTPVSRTVFEIPADALYHQSAGDELTQTDAGLYSVTLELNDAANYKWTEREGWRGDDESDPQVTEWIISPGTNEITNLKVPSWQAGTSTPLQPTCEVRFGTAAPIYEWSTSKEGGSWTSFSDVNKRPTEPGSYWLRASLAEQDNWTAAVAYRPFCVWLNPKTVFTDFIDFDLPEDAQGKVVRVKFAEAKASGGVVTGGNPGFEYKRADAGLCFVVTYANEKSDQLCMFSPVDWNIAGESTVDVRLPNVLSGTKTVRMYWHAVREPVPDNYPDEVGESEEAVSTLKAATLVNREGTWIDYWTVAPGMTKTIWTYGETPPTKDDVTSGALKVGQVQWFARSWPRGTTNAVEEIQTEIGTYRVVFARKPASGGEAYTIYPGTTATDYSGEKTIDYDVVWHNTYENLGGTLSGRVLLGNNDTNEKAPISGQAYYETDPNKETFWIHDTKSPPGPLPNLGIGINHTLYQKVGTGFKELWRVENARQGSLYPSSGTAASTRNYLPWSATCSPRTAAGAPMSTKEVTCFALHNMAGSVIYSPCYTNGIGTIYFDTVNGWTADPNAKLVVEVAKGAVDRDKAVWEKVTPIVYRASGTDLSVASDQDLLEQQTIRLKVTTGAKTTEFYRIIVPVGEYGPCRFRIRRPEKSGTSAEDSSNLILVDNIIASPPPMYAELEAPGEIDLDRKGRNVIGFAGALSEVFPTCDSKELFGRAKVKYHVTAGIACEMTNFIALARLHYRWRYLQQRETSWQTIYLDPSDVEGVDGDLLPTVESLQLPGLVGDIEWWYDMTLHAPAYKYVDYSGSTFAAPVRDYSEERSSVTNSYKDLIPTGVHLASGGTDWFVRLRNGKSDWEGVTVEITEGDLMGSYPMELVGDHQWRALVPIQDEDEGLCRVHFRARNRQQAGQEYTTGEDLVWSPVLKPQQVLLAIPGGGKLEQTSAGAPFRFDHAAAYLEFKLSDSFETFTVARAAKQDFNHWNDAHTSNDDKFFVNVPTNGVDDIHMKSYNLTAKNWSLFEPEKESWNETFYLADYHDLGFPKDIVFSKKDTPGAWSAENISFVAEKLVTPDKEDKESGLAGKLLGQGKGKIEFLKTDAPDGVDTISFRARIGQSATFDSMAYSAKSILDDNYMFFTPLTMSQNCSEEGNSLGDMAVGASVSLIAYYFPYQGCYEFRVSRPYDGKELTLSLIKWENVGGAMSPRTLCTRRFCTDTKVGGNQALHPIAWTQTQGETDEEIIASKRRFYGAFISCKTEGTKTTIVAGISQDPQQLGLSSDWATETTPASHFSGHGFNGLIYEDMSNPYPDGCYGVMAKDCPSQFMMPIKFTSPIDLSAAGVSAKAATDYKYFEAYKYDEKNKKGVEIPLTITGASDTSAFEDCRGDILLTLNGTQKIWAIPNMRLEATDWLTSSVHHYWTGLQTPTNLEQTAIVQMRQKGQSGESAWTNVFETVVRDYSLTTHEWTVPVRELGKWDIRFTTGENAVDIVFDDLKQTQWHAQDNTGEGAPGFISTQSVVEEDEKDESIRLVKLQPARADALKPVSVRGPLLSGMGHISFSYVDADPTAEVWLQVATNNVTAVTLNNSYNQSIDSVDVGGTQTEGTWLTLRKFGPKANGCDETLGTNGTKSVYLGWHDNKTSPVKGVFRLFVPPAAVERAVAAAHREPMTAASTHVGQITVTDMSVCDEPGLSDSAWRGWNMRTFGGEWKDDEFRDTERRMLLYDSTVEGEDASTGLSCGLNNTTNRATLTSQTYQPEHLDVVAASGQPAIFSPTFGTVDGRQTGVGAVSFVARLYATNQEEAVKLPGRVVVYGAHNSTGSDWTLIATNYITSTVFSNFTWSANGEAYSAIKFELSDPGYLTGKPNIGRIILDEIVISEKIEPSVSFVYARPFRQNLSSREPIADIESPNEQPLLGESWGVQTRLSLEQLEDEVDVARGFRVFLSYYPGKKPWGYEQWKNLGASKGVVLDQELMPVGDASNMVFRSVVENPESFVRPQAEGNSVVQYMLVAKYFDRSGSEKEYRQSLTASKWKQPDWYFPVDYNRDNGGLDDANKFAAYTILDTVSPGRAWINEVSWNDGTRQDIGGSTVSTTNQFIEICIPSGVDMTGWSLQLTSTTLKNGLHDQVKFFTFGGPGRPSKKTTGKAVNGYEFFVLQSPGTSLSVADATWTESSSIGTTRGTLSYSKPYQFELVRPSGIIEHQFLLEGTNTMGETSYSAEGLKKAIAAEDYSRYGAASTKRFVVGVETSRKKDGTPFASAGVIGGTATGNPAPGAEGTWETGLVFTPGALNEGQILPAGWFLPPNGTNSWVYLDIVGEHLYQQVGTNREQSILIVMPQDGKTNVVYTADNYYELDSITVNGVTNTLPTTRHNPCKPSFVYEISHPTGVTRIVATSGVDNRLLSKIDFAKYGAYAPSIVNWLTSNPDWANKDLDDLQMAHYQWVTSDSAPKHELGLIDMYWLDIPPFTASNEPEWLLRAGVTKFELLPPKVMHGTTYTNLLVSVRMFLQNDHTFVTNKIVRLQGLDNARSDDPTTFKAWKSETFKIRGSLEVNGSFLPFRTFVFDKDSFDADYQSTIELIDPFSPASPGYSYGWSLHPEKKSSNFWKISLDTDTQPTSTEMLKADDTY